MILNLRVKKEFRTLLRLAVGSGVLAACLVQVTLGADVTSWPAPPGEALSEHYELTVNGQAIPVHACHVSAEPFNQVWPGYQRPLDQTEMAGFAFWDMAGPVKVVVQSRRPVQSVVVRPASLGIRVAIETKVRRLSGSSVK